MRKCVAVYDAQMGAKRWLAGDFVGNSTKTGPLERVTQPEEIAEAVLYLCRSSGDSITGQVLHINAGSLI